jgi:hypothetical protein
MATEEPEGVQLPSVWVGADETPIAFANQFVCQFQPNEFVLTIGQASAPILLGTPDQIREQVEELSFIPVRTLARIGLTRTRVQELIAALQANLDNHDQAMRGMDPTQP